MAIGDRLRALIDSENSQGVQAPVAAVAPKAEETQVMFGADGAKYNVPVSEVPLARRDGLVTTATMKDQSGALYHIPETHLQEAMKDGLTYATKQGSNVDFGSTPGGAATMVPAARSHAITGQPETVGAALMVPFGPAIAGAGLGVGGATEAFGPQLPVAASAPGTAAKLSLFLARKAGEKIGSAATGAAMGAGGLAAYEGWNWIKEHTIGQFLGGSK